ncbi:MAG: rhodanese-like domain-containing protein [Myxococcota bacterium]
MIRLKALSAGCLFFLSAACGDVMQARPPPVQGDLLVGADWLRDNLENPAVKIIEVGEDISSYREEHIPGARFLSLEALMRPVEGQLPRFPAFEDLETAFRYVGLDDSARIILYGPPHAAARAFFLLDLMGHGARTAILNGGLAGWRDVGLPAIPDVPERIYGNLTVMPQLERMVDASWVSDRLFEPAISFIDARSPDEYLGAVLSEGMARAGHIPGAVNVFWQDTVTSLDLPYLKSPQELRQLFRDAGAEWRNVMVPYATTGVDASWLYFVSRYLGFETRMFEGSLQEWVSDETRRLFDQRTLPLRIPIPGVRAW